MMPEGGDSLSAVNFSTSSTLLFSQAQRVSFSAIARCCRNELFALGTENTAHNGSPVYVFMKQRIDLASNPVDLALYFSDYALHIDKSDLVREVT